MKTTSKRKRESTAAGTAQKAKAAPDKAARKVETATEAVQAAPGKVAPKQSATRTVVLASNCNVKDAAALKTELCKLVDEQSDVTVDAANVERVDTATMQLLCAFARDRAAHDRKLVWLGNSQVLQEAARLLGAQSLLALPQTEFKGAAA